MTESDKTGDKLAESIRKTRAGTTSRTTTTRKTTPRRATDPGPEKAEAARPAQNPPSSADPYTHGRRVWPD
jgi:hypothetical protein